MSRRILSTVWCKQCKAEHRSNPLGTVELDQDTGAVYWVTRKPRRLSIGDRISPTSRHLDKITRAMQPFGRNWTRVRLHLGLPGGHEVKLADPKIRIRFPDDATTSAWCKRHKSVRVSRRELLNGKR